MNSNLKQKIKAVVPTRLLAPLSAGRWWRQLWNSYEQSGHHDLCRRLMSRHGLTVRHGPFAGLRLPPACLLASGNTGALLGTYEMELHAWFTGLRANTFQRILDIGAAEGYYAVGMALRTGTRVDAFDPSSKARRLCRLMAKANGISQLVRTHSWCSERTLRQLEGLRAFILSDCEGFEVSLFSERVVNALANSDLIIELHDHGAPPGTTRRTLEDRFKSTHNVQVVRFKPRDLSNFPVPLLANELGGDALRAISEEGRTPNQEWLIAISRHI